MSKPPPKEDTEKRPRQYSAEYVCITSKAERQRYWQQIPEHLRRMVRCHVENWMSRNGGES